MLQIVILEESKAQNMGNNCALNLTKAELTILRVCRAGSFVHGIQGILSMTEKDLYE